MYQADFYDKYYDESGNRSIEKKGLVVNNDYNYLTFSSDNKEEVEDFIKGYRTYAEAVREAIINLSDLNRDEFSSKGEKALKDMLLNALKNVMSTYS